MSHTELTDDEVKQTNASALESPHLAGGASMDAERLQLAPLAPINDAAAASAANDGEEIPLATIVKLAGDAASNVTATGDEAPACTIATDVAALPSTTTTTTTFANSAFRGVEACICRHRATEEASQVRQLAIAGSLIDKEATPVLNVAAIAQSPTAVAAVAALTAPSHLPHFAGETTTIEMRRVHQQQRIKCFHDARHAATMGSIIKFGAGSNSSSSNSSSSNGNGITISTSASSSLPRKVSEVLVAATNAAVAAVDAIPRRVSFPKSDKELVTGYLEPANPWEQAFTVRSISEITELYESSCRKHNTTPLPSLLDHLRAIELNKPMRQAQLSLKSIGLLAADCEALEEVFKRVQYKSIDVSACALEETAASALFDMVEYYEAANELDISSNARGMTQRGWSSCAYMIGHSQALQVLIAQGNPISKLSAEALGSALNTSGLHTLKLEHCGLKGKPLYALCSKLKQNKVLKELWLAYNDLDQEDAASIADLLKVNHYIELIDISNNNIMDEGLRLIVLALLVQARELERRCTFQRAAAIDKERSMDEGGGGGSMDERDVTNGDHDNVPMSASIGGAEDTAAQHQRTTALGSEENNGRLGLPANCKEDNGDGADDDDDDTFVMVGSAKGNNHNNNNNNNAATGPTELAHAPANDNDETARKNGTAASQPAATSGQSMLHKLLSMNSDSSNSSSSSDEGASCLSTDTIAGPCSEDTSIISDDILEALPSATAATNTNTSSSNNTQLPATLAAAAIPTLPSATATINKLLASSSGSAGADAVGATSINCAEAIDDILLGDFVTKSEAIKGDENCDFSNSNSNSNNIATVAAAAAALNNNNNNNNNNNSNSQARGCQLDATATGNKNDQSGAAVMDTAGIFEVTAEERNCLMAGGAAAAPPLCPHQPNATKALDVNKNTKLGEDYDDTHSTDSAFESASEGDNSRHLPEEFSRVSTSFEARHTSSTHDDLPIDTATIATESTESLLEAADSATPNLTPVTQSSSLLLRTSSHSEFSMHRTALEPSATLFEAAKRSSTLSAPLEPPAPQLGAAEIIMPRALGAAAAEVVPKVTIAEDSLIVRPKATSTSPSPTPPPPSMSPGGGGAALAQRRTNDDSPTMTTSATAMTPPTSVAACAYITQSTRNRSQSSDSLCSDNSLDSSITSDYNFSSSTHINEKLAKNDTLTRQQQRQQDAPVEAAPRTPGGLKALAIWSNNLTKASGPHIASLLAATASLELLNIGKNCLSNEFIALIKDSLMQNTTLTTLGFQSAHLSAKGIETLASILTFGGNSTLQRIDIRDNKLEVASLGTLADVLQTNTAITQIDIDDEPKRLSFAQLPLVPFVRVTAAPPAAASSPAGDPTDRVGSEAHMDYERVLENVRAKCSRNEKTQGKLLAEKAASSASSALGGGQKQRGGYYMGSRKISLTCTTHTRPLIETIISAGGTPTVNATANNKLDVKRKANVRLRSPVPSPPSVSPSSSPNRSRFQVIRVQEVSPLTSPLVQTPPPPSSRSVAIPGAASPSGCAMTMTPRSAQSLPSSGSLAFMDNVAASTQSIKRNSVSPRSRFHVSKIYEDPKVPLAHRALPPITPPITLPPTPIAKRAPTAAAFDGVAVAVTNHVPASGNSSSRETKEAPEDDAASTDESTKAATAESVTSNYHQPPTTTTTTTTTGTATSLSPLDSLSSSATTPSPSSCSSTSSSSTSPASVSSSASSSTSSAASVCSSSATTTSSSSPHGYDDCRLESSAATRAAVPAPLCPIAVFSDNDITLTKNSVRPSPSGDSGQQRVRKTSWISNPSAVFTLFRSASPEPSRGAGSVNATTAATQPPAAVCCVANHKQPDGGGGGGVGGGNTPNSLVPTRKQSPPTWTDLLHSSGGVLDAASRQFKQVFRPNLCNESNTATATGTLCALTATASTTLTTAAIATMTAAPPALASSSSDAAIALHTDGSAPTPIEHDATLIPRNLQREIKENISPEHTINEETLHSLQKLPAGGDDLGALSLADELLASSSVSEEQLS